MQRINVILFSLMLIATQYVALAVPAGRAPVDSGCCCTGCDCAVSNEEGVPSPLSEAAVASGAYSQFVFLPVALVAYETTRATDSASFLSADPSESASGQPLYRLNCALLI